MDAPRKRTAVMLNEDACFTYPSDDGYWSALRPELMPYEPEIEWLLRRAADIPYVMLDCGANVGYWSVLASSRPFGNHAVVAIEPGLSSYAQLVENARLNDDRFQVLRCAVAEQSGSTVKLFGSSHYGLSLRADWHPAESTHCQDVETISLNDLAARYFREWRGRWLVKLDVEGAEIEALRGGNSLLQTGALVIYEDHSKDRTHAVSQYVLELEAMRVWWLEPRSHPVPVTTLGQIAAIKKDPLAGYNFFACNASSPWASFFDAAAVA